MTALQDLIIEPVGVIAYEGPFTAPIVVNLKLTNKEDKKIAYKVKCTNNARFKIRPVMGILDSNQSGLVKLICNPFDYDQTRLRNERFTVQHVYALDNANAKDAWSNNPQAKKKSIPVEFKMPAPTAADTPAATPDIETSVAPDKASELAAVQTADENDAEESSREDGEE